MDNYYVKTLVTAAIKLGPPVLFIVGGYLIFIKLPFLFLRKSMQEQKEKLNDELKGQQPVEAKYTIEDYNKFKNQMKLMQPQKEVSSKTPSLEAPKSQSQSQKKQEQKPPRQEPRKAPPREKTDEEILGFKPGQTVSMGELKKRYIELIRQNHPDKVASMGPDFKKLAEKNTKDINKAFDKLKKKAS